MKTATWGIVAIHFALLAVTLNDYRVSIDSGYHVSLGRYYAEHGSAWWDPINWGPRGRPNLQGPLMHVMIAAAGKVLGGSGDAYVLANAIVSLLQWVAAIFTILFFARRYGDDRVALYAVAMFTGSALASLSFYIGLPSGWIFIFTPWAIFFFLEGNWFLSAVFIALACYAHLGGFATAPVGVVIAAFLVRHWKRLIFAGVTSLILTAPYLVHFVRYREWYIGERGHVAGGMALSLIYLLAVPGLWFVRRQPMLVAWAIAPIAWLFQDSQRFFLQWTLCGVVIAGVFLNRFNIWPWLVVAVAQIFPLSIPGFVPEVLWATGMKYPRHMEWREAKRLAEVIHANALDRQLVYVYNHSFAPSLAAYYPMTFERGHWVEVQPRPNPANKISAGVKTYVLPLPWNDPLLVQYAQYGLVKIHGGTSKSAVITLGNRGELKAIASLVSRTIPREAYWLADHAVNNKLDPVRDLFSRDKIAARRAQRLQQRIHGGRIAVSALLYAYALEAGYPDFAEGSRGSVRAFSSMTAFLSDEWALDFIDDARHDRMRANWRRFGDAVSKLGDKVIPFDELDDASDHLFNEYFWAA
jgi:hypothetical protein